MPSHSDKLQLKFPLWAFLNQPVFSPTTRLILSPRRFSYFHRVRLLERCWQRNCQSNNHHSNGNY